LKWPELDGVQIGGQRTLSNHTRFTFKNYRKELNEFLFLSKKLGGLRIYIINYIMYHYIYKMTDPNTGEFYIGRRSSKVKPELDVTYRGSMLSWSKEDNFDKSILIKEILIKDIETIEELCKLEPIIIESVINDPLNKNAHIPSKGFCTKGPLSEEHKRKLSEIKMGKKNPLIEGTKNPMYGKMQSEEGRLKISESNKRADHPNNNREGSKNPFYGKSHSEEHKKRLSEKTVGSKNPMARKCIANGIEYGSTKEAGIALGIHPSTVRQRINSNKWKNFKYVSDI